MHVAVCPHLRSCTRLFHIYTRSPRSRPPPQLMGEGALVSRSPSAAATTLQAAPSPRPAEGVHARVELPGDAHTPSSTNLVVGVVAHAEQQPPFHCECDLSRTRCRLLLHLVVDHAGRRSSNSWPRTAPHQMRRRSTCTWSRSVPSTLISPAPEAFMHLRVDDFPSCRHGDCRAAATVEPPWVTRVDRARRAAA